MSDVARRLIRFIEDEVLLRGGAVRLAPATRLDSGLIDSLGIEYLVSFLEGEFDISIDAGDIVPGNFRTVADVERLVMSKLPAVEAG